MTPPPASGVRLHWEELPSELRTRIEAWLGGPVIEARTQTGGFSPGVAARLVTADGRRVFLKAVSEAANPHAPAFHRREATIVAAMPPAAPVPRLLWSHDAGGWVVLAFEDIDGRQPAEPWEAAELDRVLGALADLSAALTPSPIPASLTGTARDWPLLNAGYWSRMASGPPAGLDAWSLRHDAALAALEGHAPAAAAGETLLHVDLRADNVLLTEEHVWFVDWPHARVGAAWLDILFMAPSVTMQGGPPPEVLLARFPPAATATAGDVNAVLAVIAGFFTAEALQPPPPGLPTLRAFQAAQGAVARQWLAARTGLA